MLHIAAAAGQCQIVCILLDYGYNANLDNGSGLTAIPFDKLDKSVSVVKLGFILIYPLVSLL